MFKYANTSYIHMPQKITIKKDGSYIVSGSVLLSKEIISCDDDRHPVKYVLGDKYPVQETYALCRCGYSKGKPFCDGTHIKKTFNGTEIASREKYIKEAKKIEGPNLILYDQESLCSSMRFCHSIEGSVWDNTRNSDNPSSKKKAIEQACNCAAGRLVACDKKTGKPIEPNLKPAISLLEDPDNHVSGPIWVKGGIEIESSDGTKLEKRNRVTLCRCGRSENKPFCDTLHIAAKFSDGDESIDE